MKTLRTHAAISLLLLSTAPMAYAQGDTDIFNMSLEDINNMEVTSVSKSAEKASEAAAALYVINQEDIKRSGSTSVAELLRMVPGLQVARAGSSQWAVSSRGFNDQFANKLLVMVDGRSVYNATFAGVWWDSVDIPLENIDRIEVIRGPGASVWGANAVNGVINIISKNSKDTNGVLVSAGAGNDERAFTTAQYGAEIGKNAHMRVYGQYLNRDEVRTANSDIGNKDEWNMSRAGFRSDFQGSDIDNFTVQGDFYGGKEHQLYKHPTLTRPFTVADDDDQDIHGGNILARWTRTPSENSEWNVQSYIDYEHRDIDVVNISNTTFDLDVQQRWKWDTAHELVWGGGFRYMEDHNDDGSFYLNFNPKNRERYLYSGFVQDKVRLIPEELYLTFGTKVEHNSHTHMEYQPSARLSWMATPDTTVWASASRAVRNPTKATDDLSNVVGIFNGPAGLGYLQRQGDPKTESERLNAYEVGVRSQIQDDLSIDVTAFYNDYQDLIVQNFQTPYIQRTGINSPYLVYPLHIENAGEAQTYGTEIAAYWDAMENWRLTASYAYLAMDITAGSATNEGKAPHHQFSLRSYIDLPYNISFDQMLYYVGALEKSRTPMAEYVRLDSRLAWQALDSLELSLVGQNLLHDYHREFPPFLYNTQAEIGRSVYGKVTWRY